MATLPKHYLTEQEYLEIERKAEFKSEYHAGQMFAMAGGTDGHSEICTNLIALLKPPLRARGWRVFNSDMRVRIPGGTLYTYPDLSITCEPKFADDRHDTLLNPVVIIEVLSESTRTYDRGDKARFYPTIPSLLEYVLVDQYAIGVEHWRKQPDNSWVVRNLTDKENEVNLDAIGCRLALKDIYDGVL